MLPSFMPRQASQRLQGSPFWGFSQLTALERILAQVVLPVPLVPQKRYAWERWLAADWFLSVRVTWLWPITSAKI